MTWMRPNSKGVRLGDFPGWKGWVFAVEIDWATGRARPDGFHETRPRGDRRKPPSQRPDVRARIVQAAEALFGHGTGFAAVDLVVASRPDPRGTHNTVERAETVAMVYETARLQGLVPNKTLAAAYGLPVNTTGTVDDYGTTVERWVRQARAFGFLPAYDPRQHAPRRWPGRGSHPLEPRRARPMLEEPRREGPHAGRTLTLNFVPCSPITVNAAGDEVADVDITGRWSDGHTAENIPRLTAVTLAATVKVHMPQLNTDFERAYPGARVRSTLCRSDVSATT